MINRQTRDTTQNIVRHPSEKDLRINGATLKWKFQEFKNAVKNSVDFGLFLTLVSLWAMFLNISNFNDIPLGERTFTGSEIKTFFFFVTLLSTIYLLRPIIFSFSRLFTSIPYLQNKFSFIKRWHRKHETDPEKKVDEIMDCI